MFTRYSGANSKDTQIQPVPEKMRLEMLVEMQIEILHGQSSGLFSNEPFEKRPASKFTSLFK